jgi:hypothetical protein
LRLHHICLYRLGIINAGCGSLRFTGSSFRFNGLGHSDLRAVDPGVSAGLVVTANTGNLRIAASGFGFI